MLPGERLRNWIGETGTYFSEKLGGWVVKSIAGGVTKTLEDVEPGAIDSYRDALTKLRADPNTPEDLKAFIDKVITPVTP